MQVKIQGQDHHACVDTKSLGYDYEPVDITPWKDFQPTTHVFCSTVAARSASTDVANVVFPVLLDKVVKALVKRRVSRGVRNQSRRWPRY